MSRLAEHMVSVQSEAANVQTDAGQCQEFGQEEARHYRATIDCHHQALVSGFSVAIAT